MFTIMSAHCISVVLHLLKYVLLKNHKFWANIALVAKVLIYIYAVLFVQSGITYDECNDITDKMPVMVWLTYEVIAFYLNLFSVVFFLIISTFVQFKTIRDRMNLAGNMRTKMDFLRYAYDDLHWWQFWFCQLGLYCAGLAFRTNEDKSLGLSASQVATILLCGACLLKTLYFNQQFEIGTVHKVFLGGMLLITFMLIPRYQYLRQNKFPWFGPVVLQIIVAHFMVFVQLAIDYFTFRSKVTEWKFDVMFQQQYESNKEDVSETMLRD